jgi:hypothetical protein
MLTVKPTPERICAAQLRAARALLDWTQTQLAEASGISLRRLKMLESPAQNAGVAPLPAGPPRRRGSGRHSSRPASSSLSTAAR